MACHLGDVEASGHCLASMVRRRFAEHDRRNTGVAPEGYKFGTENCLYFQLGCIMRVATCGSPLESP
ncbi:hypothetical protein HAX54_023255, partial [Datura stramonium]|nr:hypothetical protein [Datura stramonium]